MNHHKIRLSRAGIPVALAVGLFLSLALERVAIADEPKKIAWREDLAQAQAEAKSRNLLLWIQFTGPWCINCRRMDRSTFAHPGVVNQSRDSFVPVKLRSDEHEALTTTLGLTTLPSTVIVRPNGEVVERYEGYVEPETFEVTLVSVLKREGRSPEQLARAKRLKENPLALAGFCPVTFLNQNELVEGVEDLTTEHEGRTFRFVSEAARREFQRNPDKYAPANDGRSPVAQVERGDFQPGDPHWGVVYGGHLFLFKTGAEREQFVKEPERYARVDRSDRFNCLHCWNKASLASRPSSRSFAIYRIEEIASPTPDRIEAFLAPSTTIRR